MVENLTTLELKEPYNFRTKITLELKKTYNYNTNLRKKIGFSNYLLGCFWVMLK
jgi:hypothetical protein